MTGRHASARPHDWVNSSRPRPWPRPLPKHRALVSRALQQAPSEYERGVRVSQDAVRQAVAEAEASHAKAGRSHERA